MRAINIALLLILIQFLYACGASAPKSDDKTSQSVNSSISVLASSSSVSSTQISSLVSSSMSSVSISSVQSLSSSLQSSSLQSLSSMSSQLSSLMQSSSSLSSSSSSSSIQASSSSQTSSSQSSYLPNLTGVAPFGVFFDLSNDYADFVGNTFAWDFDVDNADPAGRYEKLNGFVAGHVYEKPGVYKVQVKVYDDQGYLETREWMVNVTAMSGGEVYVSTSGSPTGTGTINDPINSLQTAIQLYGKPNNTIYLKRGDVFDLDDIKIDGTGPVIMRDYGDPAASLPTIRNVVPNSANNVISVRTTDWRYMNLRITSARPNPDPQTDNYPGGIELGVQSKGNVLMGLDLVNLGKNVIRTGGENNTIFDCDLHQFGANGIYAGGRLPNQYHSIIGNRVYDVRSNIPEHVLRLHEASSYFVGFNNFLANDTKSGIQLREMSNKVVVYANMLDRTSGLNPTNVNSITTRTGNLVFDSNVFVGRDDTVSPSNPYSTAYPIRRLGMQITAAHDVVIRNNIFFNYQLGADFIADTSGPTERIRMANNTFVCNDIYCGAARVCGSSCQNIDITNSVYLNLTSAPPASDNVIEIFGQGWPGTSDYMFFWGKGWPGNYGPFKVPGNRYSLSDWQAQKSQDAHSQQVNVNFESETFPLAESYDEKVDIRQLIKDGKVFVPKATSPVVGAGKVGIAPLDFFGKERGNQPSAGAIEPY